MNKIEFPKHKKSAIVSLGTRVSITSTNVRSVDLNFTRDYLLKVAGREQVDFVSRKTRKENDIEYFKDINEVDLNDYDEVIIYNASLNPFGGLFKNEALDTFIKLFDFKGDIHYWLGDPKMPPIDFAAFLLYRDRKEHTYTFGCDSKELNFKRYIEPAILDNWSEKVWNRVNVMFAGSDYAKYVEMWNEVYKKSKNQFKILNTNVNWFTIPIFEYYAINEKLDQKLKSYNTDKVYDLVYFGNNRQNERNKIIADLYNIEEYKKYFIGFDPNLSNCDIDNYVDHDKLFNLIGEKCLATVVIGDNLHNDNIKTPRFFEAMLLDCIAFIYTKFDSKREYVKNDFLKEFIYISNKDELKERIDKIKNNKELYNKIKELERKEIIDQFTYLKRGEN